MMSLGTIQCSFSICWLRMALEFKWLKMSTRTRIFDISWWFVNTRSWSCWTKSVNFSCKRVVWFVIYCLNDLYCFVSICTRTRIFVWSVCLFSFQNWVEWSNTNIALIQNALLTILLTLLNLFRRCKYLDQSWVAVLIVQIKLLSSSVAK